MKMGAVVFAHMIGRVGGAKGWAAVVDWHFFQMTRTRAQWYKTFLSVNYRFLG